MTLMVSELYDALKEAGVSEETARRAAEALADHEGRSAAVETRLTVLALMIGVSVVLMLLLLVGAFALWSRLGEIGGQIARMSP
jgi:hypothetical protein